jgi:hypothetical protein
MRITRIVTAPAPSGIVDPGMKLALYPAPTETWQRLSIALFFQCTALLPYFVTIRVDQGWCAVLYSIETVALLS